MEVYKVIYNEDTTGVYGISLVADPATSEAFIALSKQEEKAIKMATVNEEQRIVMGAVLIPDQPIYRKDGDKEFYIVFPQETILFAAHNFLKQGYQKNSTLEHDPQHIIDGVSIVESWVKLTASDKSNDYGFDYPIGTWIAMMKIDNNDIWDNYVKTGEVKGFSVDSKFPLEKVNSNLMLSEIKQAFKDAVAEIKVALSEQQAAPAEPETVVVLGAIKTADGLTTIQYEGDALALDVQVTGLDADGNQIQLPDGDYPLENGQTISVMGGKVAEISTAQEEAQDQEGTMEEVTAMLKSCLTEFAKEVGKQIEAVKIELKKDIEKQNENVVSLTKNNPENTRSYAEMTPFERHMETRTRFK